MRLFTDRRQFLRAGLAGTVIGVAGCSSDGGETTDGGGDSSGSGTDNGGGGNSGTDSGGGGSGTDSGGNGSSGMVDGPKGVVGQFQVDRENTGFVPETSVPSGPGVEWQYPQSDAQRIHGMAYLNGTIYTVLRQKGTDQKQKLVALNATSGEVLQEMEVSTGLSPAYHDGTLYVASSGVRALSPTDFSEQWAVENAETFTAGQMIPDGDAVYGLGSSSQTGDTLLQALSASDGSTQWEKPIIFSGFLTRSAPAVDDSNVYASGDTLQAFAKSDGSEQWTASVDGGKFSNPPTVVDGTVYVGTNNGRVVGYSADSGDEVLNLSTDASFGISDSMARNGTYLVGTDGFTTFALDTSANQIAWSQELRLSGTPSAAGDYILAPTAGPKVVKAINASDGSQAYTAGPSISRLNGGAQVYAVGGRVYVTFNGKVAALA